MKIVVMVIHFIPMLDGNGFPMRGLKCIPNVFFLKL